MSTNIVVPTVGESIVDARVAKWLKKEGDAVAAGEPIVRPLCRAGVVCYWAVGIARRMSSPFGSESNVAPPSFLTLSPMLYNW